MPLWCWLLLAGCSVLAPTTADTAASTVTDEIAGGLAVNVRALDETPLTDAVVWLGSKDAEPDAGATAIFLEVPPGRASVLVDGEGIAPAWAPVDVPPHHLAGAAIYPIEATTLAFDPSAGGTIDLAGLGAVEVAAGAITLGGEPAPAFDLEVVVLGPDEAIAMPGDLQALEDDEIVGPIDLFTAFYVSPKDEGDWNLDPAASFSIAIADPDAGQPAELLLYRFDRTQGYWKVLNPLLFEAGVASGELTSFGWLAVGAPAFRDRSCLVGVVETSDGTPVAGAGLLLTEEGRFGSWRAVADEEGRYCVVGSSNATATVRVWAIDQQLLGRYGATEEVDLDGTIGECGGACIQARTITVSPQ